jgi:hypothetical protein
VQGSPPSIDDLERELKFVLPAARAPLALRRLQAICPADPKYPRATVWTVYYDTAGGRSLDEKINSDYLKTKLRVRWYGSVDGVPSGPVFVEAKFRIGARREKVRVRLADDAAAIATLPLEDPRFGAFPGALAGVGVAAGPVWQPVLRLRYTRARFIEPLTASRVSLDYAITAEAVNRRRLSALNAGALPFAVLEVKGRETALPRPLLPLLHLGARQGSLSKYAAIYHHLRRLS